MSRVLKIETSAISKVAFSQLKWMEVWKSHFIDFIFPPNPVADQENHSDVGKKLPWNWIIDGCVSLAKQSIHIMNELMHNHNSFLIIMRYETALLIRLNWPHFLYDWLHQIENSRCFAKYWIFHRTLQVWWNIGQVWWNAVISHFSPPQAKVRIFYLWNSFQYSLEQLELSNRVNTFIPWWTDLSIVLSM